GPGAPAFAHVTVLRAEVVAALAPRDGATYLDVTLGGGGHAEAILDAAPGASLIGVDRDPRALEASRERLARFGDRVRFAHAPFSQVSVVLDSLGVSAVDGLVADLGISSPQIDDPARGLSFRAEGPLDMRMDPTTGETALEL